MNKIKVIVVRKPEKRECEECYSTIWCSEPIIEKLDIVEMDFDDYDILKKYYRDKNWMLMQVHDDPVAHVELNLKKALEAEKKRNAKRIAEDKRRRKAAEDRKKKAAEKKLERARQILREAGCFDGQN